MKRVGRGDRLPETLLDRPVGGVNLSPGTLRDQLGDGLHLLVFLRHLGCVFCRETIGDLRAICEADSTYPEVLFFYQGSVMEGKALLRRAWPQARAVADPDAEIYDALGIGRGGMIEMFQPAVWAAKKRAEEKGHANGERNGDIWRMPGAFLVAAEEVLWSHTYRHAADHPDFPRIWDLAGETLRPACAA